MLFCCCIIQYTHFRFSSVSGGFTQFLCILRCSLLPPLPQCTPSTASKIDSFLVVLNNTDNKTYSLHLILRESLCFLYSVLKSKHGLKENGWSGLKWVQQKPMEIYLRGLDSFLHHRSWQWVMITQFVLGGHLEGGLDFLLLNFKVIQAYIE